ncbi:GAF and ANTAR domain-containing protein [Nocardioides sp. B-3]|uniref:GAF and ANTAR domain-containing protein n=1 Tax=Nocardioides sp. B-3 TaxID=2895565 RepID=UPI003FA545C0
MAGGCRPWRRPIPSSRLRTSCNTSWARAPCHDSAWQGATMVSRDLAADSRWPLWAPKAVALGIGSALGAELVNKAGDRRLGAVNLYWARARVFTSDEVAFAHLMTRHAALALDASLTVEGLNIALDGRKRIGQARGILMERHGSDEDRAFAVLKRYSPGQQRQAARAGRAAGGDRAAASRSGDPG